MNRIYVVAPSGRQVLHLAVWAADRHELTDLRTGRTVPICGSDAGRKWEITGPWAGEWPTHSRYGMCMRCRKTLDQLTQDLEALRWAPARFDGGA